MRTTIADPATADLYVKVRKMSSDHLARVLEFYMFRIVSALCDLSKQGHNLGAVCIAALAQNRRKVSPMDRDVALKGFFYATLADSSEPLKTVFLATQVEPSVLFGFLELDPFDEDLFPLRRHINQLMFELAKFKALVVQRYEHLIRKQAGALVWAKKANGLLIDPDDTDQNFYMAIFRAMDKYDPNSGTFTSYVSNWLKNAWNSGFAMAIGESFSISRSERSKIREGSSYTNNHAASLDDAGHVEDDTDTVENLLATKENRKDLNLFVQALYQTGQLPNVVIAAAMTIPPESLRHGLQNTNFKASVFKKKGPVLVGQSQGTRSLY